MALHDEILKDVTAGRVPKRFRCADLKTRPAGEPGRYQVGDSEFSGNTLTTVPRNLSVRPDWTEPGDYVRKGQKPKYFRFANGLFELIAAAAFHIEGGSAPSATPGRALLSSRSHTETDGGRPPEIVAEYLAFTPYQPMWRKKPYGDPCRTLAKRLEAYFWPHPEQGWQETVRVIDALSERVQKTVESLRTGASPEAEQELLDAFRAICAWGGVDLPAGTARGISQEVIRSLHAIDGGTSPPSDCRINSAWTKLYALARPNACVIFDSRVATAITSILDPVMDQVLTHPDWARYKDMGTIPGQGGTRPRDLKWGWRNRYGRWAGQLAANRFCLDLQGIINTRASADPAYRKTDGCAVWTLREVEALLFMEGY